MTREQLDVYENYAREGCNRMNEECLLLIKEVRKLQAETRRLQKRLATATQNKGDG